MTRWLFAVLAFAMLALSCGPTARPLVLDGGAIQHNHQDSYWEEEDFPLLVLIDDQMDDTHQEAVFRAVLEWHDVLGFDVFDPAVVDFSEPAERTHGILAVSIRELGSNSRGELLGLHEGMYHPDSPHKLAANLWFDTDAEDHDLERIMIHELGHALCLAHDEDDPRSIMYWSATARTYQWIMPDDALWVRRMRYGHYIPPTAGGTAPRGLLLVPFPDSPRIACTPFHT